MLARLRSLDPVCAGLAATAAVVMFLLAGTDPFWSDWGMQDGRVVALLMDGEVDRFVNGAAATYLPSLVLRSPRPGTAAAFGGSEDEAFYVAKGFALLMLGGLATWLLTQARARGATPLTLLIVVLVTIGNPIAAKSLGYGHAEDLMAAVMAIVGVLAASRGRLTAAGLLVGLAFVMKQWAILAWLPAAAVAPQRPWRVLATAAPVAALFFVPLLFRDAAGGGLGAGLQSEAFDIWRSHQWFWPLGVDNPDPRALRPKLPPEWFLSVPRMVIVGLSLPLSALWYRHRRRGGGHRDDVLLLLAVLFLGRVVFEPWNIDYYHLPFLLTLATWEIVRGRVPLLALVATALTHLSFGAWLEIEVYGDATYVMYVAWTLPLAFVLVRELLFPGARLAVPLGRAAANPQGVQPASR